MISGFNHFTLNLSLEEVSLKQLTREQSEKLDTMKNNHKPLLIEIIVGNVLLYCGIMSTSDNIGFLASFEYAGSLQTVSLTKPEPDGLWLYGATLTPLSA